jgi:hypothetical protein
MPEKVKKYKVFAGCKRIVLIGVLSILTDSGIVFQLDVHGLSEK